MKSKLLIILFLFIILFGVGCNKEEESHVFTEDSVLEETISEEDKYIDVDIKGLVNKPGVYSIAEGTNINDLITLAGGIKKNATTDNINLAMKLKDEMIVIIKSKNELTKHLKTEEVIKPVCQTPTYDCSECLKNSSTSVVIVGKDSDDIEVVDKDKKISINKASLDELMQLSGIGEAKAKAIIEYRNTHGLFEKIEDIINVSGIGEKIFEQIKDDITI